MMHTLTNVLRIVFLAACGFAILCPTLADPSTDELKPDSTIDQILDALDARGKDFKTFTADVKLAETPTDFGDTTTKSGKIWYQDRGNGDARIRVSFDTIDHSGKQSKEKLDYKLADGKLVERNYRAVSQDTRQVVRPDQKINLLKLGEGPFPLPIGQSKDEVHKEFDVKKMDAAKDDPANTVHIQLVPHPDTRFAKDFKTIDAWVDDKTHMPIRIGTRDANETTDRTTDLSNVQINPDLKDSDFDLEKIDLSKWNVTEEAYQE
jgi:outer membrane lipoprotein-sorting protein